MINNAKRFLAVMLTGALTVTSLATAYAAETKVAAASVKVSLQKKSDTLTIRQDGAKIKKDSAKIRVKKAKGVKIKKISYQVSDPEVVKVDKDGKVTPKTMGATDVTVSVKYLYHKKTTTAELKYKAKVKQTYKHILSGLTLKYNTYATFVDGAEGINPCYDTSVKVSDKFFAWDCLSVSVADPTVAEIGKNGFILGKKVGTTEVTITSTDDTDLSVTATLKVVATRDDLERKDDLYNSVRTGYIAAVESGWDEEEKQRYVSEDGTVSWSISDEVDFQMERNRKKIKEKYTSIEKQPDNTPEDALNSLLTTGRDMLEGGEKVEQVYIQIMRDKVIEPIKEAGSIEELIKVSEDLEKRGLTGLLNCSDFALEQKNKKIAYDYGTGRIEAPKEPVDISMLYISKITAPINMAGFDLSSPEATKKTKKDLQGDLNVFGFKQPDKKEMNAFVAFLKEFSESFHRKDSDGTTQKISKIEKMFPHLKILEHLQHKGYQVTGDDLICVECPGAYEVLDKYLAKKKNLNILKMYLAMASSFFLMQYTREELRITYDANPEMLDAGGDSVDGVIEDQYVKQMDSLESLLPWDMDHIYTDTVFPKSIKPDFEKLVQEYMDAYHKAITDSGYGETYKTNMLKKLDKMGSECLYPDADIYKKYEIPYDLVTAAEGGNLADNLLKIRQYYADLCCMTIGKKYGELKWWYPKQQLFEFLPSENNAMYNQYGNKCVFFYGGIGLDKLFFQNPNKSIDIDVKNIGYMATTIGHEMGHAFDNLRSNIDENGDLCDLWGDGDKSVYSDKVEKLKKIYGSLVAYTDSEDKTAYYQPGERIVAEAMADLGGTEISLRIIKDKYPGRDDLIKKFYEYTAEQWMTTKDDRLEPYEKDGNLKDPHPFARTRTNGVASMMDEFYRAFDVKETDAMYVAPEDRVRLW